MNKKIIDSSKVLSDLKYFDGLVVNQTQRILSQIKAATACNRTDENLTELVACVASCLGELSARIEVIEMALTAETPNIVESIEQTNGNVTNDSDSAKVIQLSRQLPEEAIADSSNFSSLTNFYKTEYTTNNIAYNWTGENSETHIDLLVSRNVEKQLRIRVVNTLKQEALQNVEIRIDGQQVTHQSIFDGEFRCIVAMLPVEEDKNELTRITIVYPDVCTPESISNSIDNRYLGLAINSIGIGYPVINQISNDNSLASS